MKKQIISILLVAALAFSLLPMTVLAADNGTFSASYGQDDGSVFYSVDGSQPDENENSYLSNATDISFQTNDTIKLLIDPRSCPDWKRWDSELGGDGTFALIEAPQYDPSICILARYDESSQGAGNGLNEAVVINGELTPAGRTAGFTFADNVLSFAPPNPNHIDFEIWWTEEAYRNDTGSGDSDPNPPRPDVWTALKSEIENYTFAYGPASGEAAAEKEMLKKGIAAELYARKMGNGPQSSDKSLGMALGFNPESTPEGSATGESMLLDAITIKGEKQSDGIAGLSYYTFDVRMEKNANGDTLDVDTNTEGEQPFTASGKVYVLANDRQFIVKTTTVDEQNSLSDTYQVVDSPVEVNGTAFIYADYSDGQPGIDTIAAFGNGAMLNGIEAEDGDVSAFHVTQEHAGSLNSFVHGARLVVSRIKDSVHLGYSENAAPWDFVNVGVNNLSGEADQPNLASVFYGAKVIVLRAVDYSNVSNEKGISDVKVLGLPEAAVTVGEKDEKGEIALTFNSNYDVIPLEITYTDSTTGYLTLKRVGLSVDSHDVVGAPDAEHFCNFDEENAAYTQNWNSDTFVVAHGTDQFIRYKATSEEQRVITATFYYDNTFKPADPNLGNDESRNAIANAYAALEQVSLYVTITHASGTVERRLVPADQAITVSSERNATVVDNGGFRTDDGQTLAYAGQGTCHLYDEFIVWSGSSDEYDDIQSVNVIVFEDGDSFGGVQVGSGAGVFWENN